MNEKEREREKKRKRERVFHEPDVVESFLFEAVIIKRLSTRIAVRRVRRRRFPRRCVREKQFCRAKTTSSSPSLPLSRPSPSPSASHGGNYGAGHCDNVACLRINGARKFLSARRKLFNFSYAERDYFVLRRNNMPRREKLPCAEDRQFLPCVFVRV